jgi:Glu-tRNA(Gln) amidotransferase subunit E-like FAD-binding protein
MQEIDYKKIELKVGLECHVQLQTKSKLFCRCSTGMAQKEPLYIVKRKQHFVASELGEVDVAAQYEYLRNREFYYQVFPGEVCLIDLDESPPMQMNPEALEIALQIALLLNCRTIPSEIQVMRKTVIDGSTPMGFQRTAIVGLNGFLEYNGKKVEIKHVALEEDAAAIVKEENGKVTYKLSRLGIPLVEIGTGLLIGYSPEEIQEIAYLIGIICKSTGKIKRGIGTIRQDINVSIKGGERVEIKGVQELGLLSKIIKLEVERQLSLPEVKKETRAVNPDGTTRFTRPLPGAHRLYPETDHPPIVISEELIKRIKKSLPEPWTKKLERFRKELKLSEELSTQILKSDYLDLFERIVKKFKVSPSVIANVFVSTLKDLRKREEAPIENLKDEDFERLFELLEKEKIVKESVPDVLLYKSKNSDLSLEECIKKLGLESISKDELRKIVKDVIRMNRDKPIEKIIGIVMSKVRGRIKSEDVVRIVKEEY